MLQGEGYHGYGEVLGKGEDQGLPEFGQRTGASEACAGSKRRGTPLEEKGDFWKPGNREKKE